MRLGQKLIYLACATVLAGCGGGGDSDDGGTTVPSVQQFPGGVWVGEAGPLGGTRQQFIGVIDGGDAGRGGIFYFAKSTGGVGYDGLYGTLSVTQATLRATNATYFSTTDATFSTAPITVSGTVTGAATDNKANARISGNYSNPAGTAAATGGIVPFTLNYSKTLTEHPSSLALIRGTYRTGGFFGGGSVLTIDGDGKVTGNNVGCTLNGQVSVPNNTRGIYGISLTLGGANTVCPQTGTTQSGVAVVQYSSFDIKTNLWVFTYNQSGSRNTFVLNATADAEVPAIPPANSTQVAEGLFQGTVTTVGGSAQPSTMVVLPNDQYFLYRNVGAGYDVLYGSLLVTADTSVFRSTNGVYYASQGRVGTEYTTPVSVTGDVRTRSTLQATFGDPSRANAVATVNLSYDPLYTARPAALTYLANKSFRSSNDFLGGTTTLTISASGAITGTSSENCTVGGSIQPYSSTGSRNLYSVSLTYTGERCPLLTKPTQNGVGFIEFDDNFNAARLQLLTTALSRLTGERFNTVFVGENVPTPPVVVTPTTPTTTTPTTTTP